MQEVRPGHQGEGLLGLQETCREVHLRAHQEEIGVEICSLGGGFNWATGPKKGGPGCKKGEKCLKMEGHEGSLWVPESDTEPCVDINLKPFKYCGVFSHAQAIKPEMIKELESIDMGDEDLDVEEVKVEEYENREDYLTQEEESVYSEVKKVEVEEEKIEESNTDLVIVEKQNPPQLEHNMVFDFVKQIVESNETNPAYFPEEPIAKLNTKLNKVATAIDPEDLTRSIISLSNVFKKLPRIITPVTAARTFQLIHLISCE